MRVKLRNDRAFAFLNGEVLLFIYIYKGRFKSLTFVIIIIVGVIIYLFN